MQLNSVVKSSYVISYKIAKAMKPFTEGEFLIDCMLSFSDWLGEKGEEFSKCISMTPFSDSTVRRRTSDISKYIVNRLKGRV